MSDLLAAIPTTTLVPAGHYGPNDRTGVSARRVPGLAATTMAARKGMTAALCRRLSAAGLPLADAPRAAEGAGLLALGTGPGRWLVFCEGTAGTALLARLQDLAGGEAVFTDQSDANLVFEITGPHAREALAKGLALDLDPGAFKPGDVATTIVAHVGLTFWRVDDGQSYRACVARSFAPAFLRWLTLSAAELGFALSGTGEA